MFHEIFVYPGSKKSAVDKYIALPIYKNYNKAWYCCYRVVALLLHSS